MIGQVLPAFVNDVEQAFAVHSDVVCRLPRVFVRELRPIVLDLVPMFTIADHELLPGFLRGQHTRRGQCGSGGGEETTAGDAGGFHVGAVQG